MLSHLQNQNNIFLPTTDDSLSSVTGNSWLCICFLRAPLVVKSRMTGQFNYVKSKNGANKKNKKTRLLTLQSASVTGSWPSEQQTSQAAPLTDVWITYMTCNLLFIQNPEAPSSKFTTRPCDLLFFSSAGCQTSPLLRRCYPLILYLSFSPPPYAASPTFIQLLGF